MDGFRDDRYSTLVGSRRGVLVGIAVFGEEGLGGEGTRSSDFVFFGDAVLPILDDTLSFCWV